jgi:cation:H+ antiporter
VTPVVVWIEFVCCVAIILVAGTKVARYGDVLAEKTGLGGLWIGVVLLSVVTSLPELFNGISSVALVKAPDLTVGDLFGSNVFNLLIIALLDIVFRDRPLLTVASKRQLLPAGLSMIPVAFSAVCIYLGTRGHDLGLGWIGAYTPILLIMYLVMMRIVLGFERRQKKDVSAAADSAYAGVSLRRAYVGFAAAAMFVIGAGTWLAFIGRDIADVMGWGESFVGSLFIAVSTSLPEITVSFTAFRLGAVDMLLGNVLGSNLFNMAIIGVDDIFYREGPILAAVSESHIFTGVIAVAMTCVVMGGLVFRTRLDKRLGFGWYALLLAGLFVVAAYLSYANVD